MRGTTTTRAGSAILVGVAMLAAIVLVVPRPTDTGPASDDEGRVPGLMVNAESMARSIAEKEARHRERAARIRRGEPVSATHADAALEWRRRMRTDADGTIPRNALIEARETVRSRGVEYRDAGIWSWEWIGPGNIGGRIRAILPDWSDDGKILVGGVSGGLWETDDHGGSWYPIDDFMANLNVTSLARDAVDPNVIYVATGEGYTLRAPPGNGVFLSTTGTAGPYTQLTSTLGFEHVNRVVAHPTDEGRVLIGLGTPHLEVRESFDQGQSWTPIFSSTRSVTDVELQPGNPSIMLVGTFGGGYRSVNGGATWDSLSVGGLGKLPAIEGRVEFTMHADGTAYALVNDGSGRIYQSLDAGWSWAFQYSGTDLFNGQGNYDNIIWVDPSNSSRILLGGIDLWRSVDGGLNITRISNWTQYHVGNSAHADQHAIVPAIGYDGTTSTTVYFGNDGGIQRNADPWTTTQTSNWENLASNLGVTQFYHGAASPDGSVIVGGTQDNDHLRYSPLDGFNDWYQAETGDGGDCVVNPDNPNIIYAEYVYATLEKSTNGGDTYSNIWSGIGHANGDSTALFIAPFDMNPDDSDELMVGCLSLWRTQTAGSSWAPLTAVYPDSELVSAVTYAPSDGSRVWIGYDNGRVMATANGGSTWIRWDNTNPSLPDRYVTDIAIHPTNPSEVWVTFGGYHGEQVWRTTDAGLHWEDRTGLWPTALPVIHVNTITLHPDQPSWVYVGTDLGIFASEDGGENWNVTPEFAGHDGPANVEVSDLFWYDPGMLVAATYGRGMFVSQPLPYVYVDGDYAGSGDGTASAPFDNVSDALDVAGNGTTISVEAGDYDEAGPVSITRRVTIDPQGGTVTIR